MRIVFTFSLEKEVIIKEIEGNLLMQNFLGVNKMFYGRCKNGEYVNNFFIIFALLLFFNFTLQKMRDQHLARFLSFSVRSWIALRYCLFSNGFQRNLLYSQLALNKHLFRRTILWCWPLSLSSLLTTTMLSIRQNLSKTDNRHFRNHQRTIEKCFR